MRIFGVIMLLLVACGGGQQKGDQHKAPDKIAPRMDLHCTPQTGFDEAVCHASGKDCHYGPPLICRGIDVPDYVHDQERQAYEAGTQPCTCTCEEDRVRCMMVP